MAPDAFAPRKPLDNLERPNPRQSQLPADLAAAIVSAFARRAALEAAGRSSESLEPMWWLAVQICTRVPGLAGEPGVVGIRLCELPVDAQPSQAWARIRTAAKADEWEYAHDHHHCVRVGDWRGWVA